MYLENNQRGVSFLGNKFANLTRRYWGRGSFRCAENKLMIKCVKGGVHM